MFSDFFINTILLIAFTFITGLYNRRHFDKMLNWTFERVLENKENLSCFMVDIDYFKRVNDTYGHAVGDIVIKEISDILTKTCRTFDIIGRIKSKLGMINL